MRLVEVLSAVALTLSLQQPLWAEITEAGTGLSYGRDHAYFITAPAGWVLDTESGVSQGIYAVFYPKGSSWKGPAVMYTNAAGREGRTPEVAIKHDEEAMRSGSSKLKVVPGGSIQTKDNKTAVVKYFTGDKFGSYEAAGYIVEKNVVANIILTARNKAEYDKALPAFRSLVQSYRFISDEPDKLDLRALAKAEYQRGLKEKAAQQAK
ncbi:MAG: hypothetical protein WCT03_01640 [Candidatus Obscuribacterales bacterium]|jgi:hypothetical protein